MNRDEKSIKQAAMVMRALVHPLRLQILTYIDKSGSINVNKIYRALDLEQSITSQHLRILRDAELVITTREGKFIYYTVNHKKIDHVNKKVSKFFK